MTSFQIVEADKVPPARSAMHCVWSQRCGIVIRRTRFVRRKYNAPPVSRAFAEAGWTRQTAHQLLMRRPFSSTKD